MGKRDESKSVWITDEIMTSLQKRKEADGFVGGMNIYIENILNQYSLGRLVNQGVAADSLHKIAESMENLKSYVKSFKDYVDVINPDKQVPAAPIKKRSKIVGVRGEWRSHGAPPSEAIEAPEDHKPLPKHARHRGL